MLNASGNWERQQQVQLFLVHSSPFTSLVYVISDHTPDASKKDNLHFTFKQIKCIRGATRINELKDVSIHKL